MADKRLEHPVRHIEQLTWLRGAAAFLVIICHVRRATETAYNPSDFNLGYFGVALFFALSGCTLFISNADKITNVQNLLGFYVRRFFRIWPAYIVSLAFYIIFIPVFKMFYGPPQGFWIERQFWVNYSIQDLLKYITLIFNFTGPINLFNGAYWSLPIEFQYYLIFPLLVLSLKYMGTLGPMLISALIYAIPFIIYPAYPAEMRVEFFTMAFIFSGGVLLGYMTTKNFRQISRASGIGLLIFCLVTVTLIQMGYITSPALPWQYPDQWGWYGIFAILTVFTVLIAKIHFHARIESFLKAYGEMSYSTYLYHNLFIGSAVLIEKETGIYNSDIKVPFVFFFAIACTYIAAKISYLYIEAPSNKFGHTITLKRHSNNTQQNR